MRMLMKAFSTLTAAIATVMLLAGVSLAGTPTQVSHFRANGDSASVESPVDFYSLHLNVYNANEDAQTHIDYDARACFFIEPYFVCEGMRGWGSVPRTDFHIDGAKASLITITACALPSTEALNTRPRLVGIWSAAK